MLVAITVLFIIGYLAIALEHPLRIDKTASALLLGMLLWVLYAIGAETIVPAVSGEELKEFIASSSAALQEGSLAQQCIEFILNVQIIEHMGDISSTLFFLVGAMTIVELIDVHGGFSIITDRITTRKKRRLLWILGIITFFLGRARQPHDHHRDGHAAAQTRQRPARTLDLRQYDCHRSQYRRCLVAHR